MRLGAVHVELGILQVPQVRNRSRFGPTHTGEWSDRFEACRANPGPSGSGSISRIRERGCLGYDRTHRASMGSIDPIHEHWAGNSTRPTVGPEADIAGYPKELDPGGPRKHPVCDVYCTVAGVNWGTYGRTRLGRANTNPPQRGVSSEASLGVVHRAGGEGRATGCVGMVLSGGAMVLGGEVWVRGGGAVR